MTEIRRGVPRATALQQLSGLFKAQPAQAQPAQPMISAPQIEVATEEPTVAPTVAPEEEFAPTIRRTTAYHLFSLMPLGNRVIAKSNLNHKRYNLLRHGFLKRAPITVYEEFGVYFITDGQHRFLICKEENLPFWFQVVPKEDAIKEMVILNSDQTNWKESDFGKHHADSGNQFYSTLEQLAEKFKLQRTIVRRVVTPEKATKNNKEFKNGELTFDLGQTPHFEHTFQQMDEIKRVGQYTFNGRSSFNSALLEFVSHANYEHTRMLEKLSGMPDAIRNTNGKRQFLYMLTKVYNKGLRAEDRKLSFKSLKGFNI